MTNQFIIYRDVEEQQLLDDMIYLMEESNETALAYSVVNRLVNLAEINGFKGNLWHCFLAYIIATHENAFSMSCEIRGKVEGSINDVVLNDFHIMRKLFDYDFDKLDKKLGLDIFKVITGYQCFGEGGRAFNKRIRNDILELSEKLSNTASDDEFLDETAAFYKKYGVGRLVP